MMELYKVIELYAQEEKAPRNSYQWYRNYAKNNGYVLMGSVHVPTFKINGVWHVDTAKFEAAIESHRKSIEHMKQITQDYENGIIHGKDGDTISTEWGGYRIHGSFRFVWFDYEVMRKKSDGRWYCNKCNMSAETEHNKEECHLCSDWHGCGRDCTLSRIYCKRCGAYLMF